ncbi:uncharacterized protein LOC119446885 isoform X3 [Dermacentor silvarum]|uniref:uncharacterized protein LOC119446885 isoform X3 n=1 Tax=Dermacentor silvarum TaxID=543639 RepID=UPI001897D76F|nr:uncharacterized protein LOC119446885 isoform X3 [Dermacentor silvarum]
MMDGLPLPGGCVDRRGTPVEHGDRYTPEGKDPCEQCTCQRGRPDSCSITSCYPPAHCHQPYLRGSGECCDYACNGTTLGSPDGADVQSATTLGLRMVASTVASFLIVALLLFMIHRLRKRRLLVMIRRLNGCRAAASLEEACLARQLALEEQGVGFLGGFCPDPPPPYTFWKPPEAYVPPGEAPPPYDAPPALLDRQQQQLEVAPNSAEPLPRVASATPPLLCGGSSTSSEAGELPQQQRAIRSDAYYEDGLRHVTVVLVGDQAARRRLSHCEPSVRHLVQDGDKRLSLQGPPSSQNNNVYPDPTSWGGEGEEGGSETSSSCTASVDDRQGAFSPTSSESSASADAPEVDQVPQPAAAAAADPPRARHPLDRTLQRLKRFSMPKRKVSKKAPAAGASSSAEGIATSCCLGHSSGMESDKSRTRESKAASSSPQGIQQLPESSGGLERLSALPPEARHSSAACQESAEDKATRKKTSKRKLFSLPSWDSSVLRRVPEGRSEVRDLSGAHIASEAAAPTAGMVRDVVRPCSLDLPTATSTPKNLNSACPVVITVKCRPVRTEQPSNGLSNHQAESPRSSSSASASSKTNKQRTTEITGAEPKPNGSVTVQSYVEAVHTIPRQSVARQVARLEAQGFRPPDASCTLQKHCRSASHDSRCQERQHCKAREGQSTSHPAAPF